MPDGPQPALAVLEILAGGGSPSHLRERITALSTGTGDPAVQRAAELGLAVCGGLERRQQRETELTSLVDTARELTAPQELDPLLRVITRRARLLLGGDIAYIALRTDEGDVAEVRVSDGHVSALNIGLRVPGGAGLGGEVLTNPSPFWTPDYLHDNRLRHDPGVDEVVRAEGLHAILAVPLSGLSGPVGALYLGARSVRHFTREEVALLSSLGDLAGVAIQRARLLDDATATAARESADAREVHGRAARLTALVAWQRELLELAISGDGPQVLAEAARERLGGGIRISHANGAVLATAGDLPEISQSDEAAHAMAAHAADGAVAVGAHTRVAAIRAGRENLGLVLHNDLAKDGGGDGSPDLLGEVARAAAVLLAQPGKSVPAPCEGRSDVLDDLLAQPQLPPQQLERRSKRIGLDLDRPHVVLVIAPEGGTAGTAVTWASMRAHREDGLASTRNGAVVMLVPGDDPGAAARSAHAELAPMAQQPVTVGAAGPVTGPSAVYHGYQEALRCVEAMSALGLTGQPGSARELGFFGVLLSDNHDVDGFIEATIGPVIDYDQLRMTELSRTLEAYFETGGSPTYAAQRLHVHANTVARRLERITELLGADWQRPERQLEVQLALRLARIRRIVQQRRSTD